MRGNSNCARLVQSSNKTITVVATLILSFFTGSVSADLRSDTELHPFEPCPDTPNCIIQSIQFNIPSQEIFEITQSVLTDINPNELHFNKDELKADAVFRIRLFGFKDDVNIAIKPISEKSCYFHIKSASRVGHSDLGVNRRRVDRIISHIQTNLSNK